MKFNKNVERLLGELNAEFDPEYVPVIVESYAKLHHCYNNVNEKVRIDGGEVFYGWIIHETDILCEAERHAVWKDYDDNLIDISPNQSNSKEILFLSDNNYTYNGIDVDNVRINITTNFMVDDFIYISEFISKLYALGERVNDDEVNLPAGVSKLIFECKIVK
jgi:hypothetical protein